MNKINFNVKTENLTFEEVFKKFIERKKALNLSEETIVYYEECIKYFSKYFDPKELALNITQDTYYRLY